MDSDTVFVTNYPKFLATVNVAKGDWAIMLGQPAVLGQLRDEAVSVERIRPADVNRTRLLIPSRDLINLFEAKLLENKLDVHPVKQFFANIFPRLRPPTVREKPSIVARRIGKAR
jgi:hypothetical protein